MRGLMLSLLNTLEERSKFVLLYTILDDPLAAFETDGKTYFAARSGKRPVWFYTADNASYENLCQAEQSCAKFANDGNATVICKEDFYEFLKRKGGLLSVEERGKLGCYYCKDTVAPACADGEFCLARRCDADCLTDMFMSAVLEMHGENAVKEKTFQTVSDSIENNSLYVWKNCEGTIVACAGYIPSGNFARVVHVYTVKEQRRKGYAANLVCRLARELLNQGLTPVLYTDYSYAASNALYKHIGFTDNGFVAEISVEIEHSAKSR
ncbi:MAG: GNAT family N-acetyltransferase [Corallococcus sp.]|nr:GNAT family N-acetyltransferase [Corallococcus sp.]